MYGVWRAGPCHLGRERAFLPCSRRRKEDEAGKAEGDGERNTAASASGKNGRFDTNQ